MSDSGSPISRRESLKKAAGALALGLGAPAALAAPSPEDDAFRHIKFVFYKDSLDEAVGHVTLPHDLVDKLSDEDGIVIMKYVKTFDAETRRTQTFDVRPAR